MADAKERHIGAAAGKDRPVAPTIPARSRREDGVPVVSVIMPCYRVSQYVAEALDSVLAQTFKSYEIIVVNDGSPDTEDFERVLEPYLERLVYIKQENQGVSSARNTAIRAASGKYLALLDPDDIWEPNYLEIQVGILESRPSVDLVYPNARLFGSKAVSGQLFTEQAPSQGEVTFESLVTQRCNVMASVTARREAIVRVGMFDETIRSSEDFDLWIRLVLAGGRIVYHDRPLLWYRRWPDSQSADPSWMCYNILKVFHKAAQTLSLAPREREVVLQQIARYQALENLAIGKKAFFDGDATTAHRRLSQANEFFKSRKLSLICRLLRAAPWLLSRAYDLRDRFILKRSTKY